MTDQQRTAIENPCLFAFETINPKFASWFNPFVYVLTVNHGYA